MVATDCLASVDICLMRVAQLTAAGAPRTGAHGYVTDKLETAKIGTTSDTVNALLRRNGCGQIVTTRPAVVSVSGSQFSVDLTAWERDLIALLCGGTPISSGGHTLGYKSPLLADGATLPVCIELWSRAWDSSVQAVTAQSTPNPSYHCWVLPFVQCDLSTQFTLATGDTIFTVTGTGVENPNITVNGPWNDWPAAAIAQNGFNSAFGEFDDSTLPTATCGLATVPSGS